MQPERGYRCSGMAKAFPARILVILRLQGQNENTRNPLKSMHRTHARTHSHALLTHYCLKNSFTV
ncbi:MAG: hypothetical protein DESF_00872 [Desulfovibrio sp.]